MRDSETNGVSESVVLCEGYYDRAFWAGWLLHAGCLDPGIRSGKVERQPVFDTSKQRVSAPEFGFYTPTGNFVRVVPCSGSNNILRVARRRLDQRRTKPLSRLLLSYDLDRSYEETDGGLAILRTRLETLAREFDGKREGEFYSVDGTIVALVAWHALDVPAEGLPDLQTLERMLCAALVAAYPNRAPSVQRWLDTRPDAPDASHKHFCWSVLRRVVCSPWRGRFLPTHLDRQAGCGPIGNASAGVGDLRARGPNCKLNVPWHVPGGCFDV